MRFEWDEAKNRANLRKHGFHFADAAEMFDGPFLARPDTREDYEEERWIGIGMTKGRVALVAFSVEGPRNTSNHFPKGRRAMKSAKNTKLRSRTDWKRIDAMRDEDIDFSDIPELGPDFFANAILWPGPKRQITLRLDPDVLKFFRKQGRGYQTTINAVLRKYMEAQERRT
jgi:uncharacterized DUF497 family protein/uncharacterized protein (DUF4415 family)